jgi:glycosyltransferase involved in cell wall biosynthesis
MLLSQEPGRILYVQYTNPGAYPPLLHSSHLLAAKGWQVLFLGTRALGSNALTIPDHPSIRFLHKTFCPPGWKQKIHYLWFSLWCVYWTFRWRPGWIYASDHWSCLPALLAHWITRRPFIYHEHDAPPPLGHTGNTRLLRFVYWARRRSARAAVVCVIPNENRAKLFRAETGASKIKIVWNCPTRDEVHSGRNGSGPVLRLLYHGSIVPERLPLAVIRALPRVFRPVCLKIVGYETTGSHGYLNQIR